jgi:hypothetical protein
LPAVRPRVVQREAYAALGTSPHALDALERCFEELAVRQLALEVLTHGPPSLNRGT